MLTLTNRCRFVFTTIGYTAPFICACLLLPATSHEIVRRDVRTHHFLWSAKVSSTYPPSSPLVTRLGDTLRIDCPENATSNIWIQTHRLQFDQCNCSAPAEINSSSPECTPGPTTRLICQEEVVISITSDREKLTSALSFEPDTMYYLTSYSSGDRPLAGFTSTSISGGECLRGFKMVLHVQAQSTAGTRPSPPTTQTGVYVSPPMNVQASQSSASAPVEVSWSPPSGGAAITGYRIFYGNGENVSVPSTVVGLNFNNIAAGETVSIRSESDDLTSELVSVIITEDRPAKMMLQICSIEVGIAVGVIILLVCLFAVVIAVVLICMWRKRKANKNSSDLPGDTTYTLYDEPDKLASGGQGKYELTECPAYESTTSEPHPQPTEDQSSAPTTRL